MANALADLITRRNLGFAGSPELNYSAGQDYTPQSMPISNASLGYGPAGNMQPPALPQGTPIEVFGRKGVLTPSGEMVGQGWKAWTAEDYASMQAAKDKALQDQMKQAQLEHLRAQTQSLQAQNAPSEAGGIDKSSPEYKSGVKQLEKDDAQMSQAQALTNAYQRWGELQSKVDTGPIAGRRLVSFDPNYQEMKQLENYLTMNNFKPGQGSISNTERAFMKGSGPNTLNEPQANMDIVNIGLGAAQNMQDRANFREQWLMHKGNLYGSDQAWQKYLDENPRYVPDKSGRMQPNQNRTDWTDYFSGKSAAKPSATQAPSDADLKHTAMKYGLTVDQVKQRLGLQ